MTYRCAVHGLEHLGIRSREYPAIYCDGPGCDAMMVALTKSGGPPAWLLDGKPPKGWLCKRDESKYTRLDVCPKCRAAGVKP